MSAPANPTLRADRKGDEDLVTLRGDWLVSQERSRAGSGLHHVPSKVENRKLPNYFADIGQTALEPSNVLPSIHFSLDYLVRFRIISASDAHHGRLGSVTGTGTR